MLISLIMQIAQSMQISIRHFLNPQTMHITFPLKNLAVKNISGLTHCRYSSDKWTICVNIENNILWYDYNLRVWKCTLLAPLYNTMLHTR